MLVNDAYEMGDYSREEWLVRKKKRELEISKITDEIYELHKRENSNQQLSNAERLKARTNFFDNITVTTDNASRNDLYRTILESIMRYYNNKATYALMRQTSDRLCREHALSVIQKT